MKWEGEVGPGLAGYLRVSPLSTSGGTPLWPDFWTPCRGANACDSCPEGFAPINGNYFIYA